MKEVIILAGGFGTRLKHVVQDLPKPLAPVAGKPFIFYIIDQLLRFGYTHFIFSLGYRSKLLIDAIKSGYPEMNFDFCVENKPLLTGGAIRYSLDKTNTENILIINGDTFLDVQLDEMMASHLNNKSDVTLALKAMSNFDRYGVVNINIDNRINSFEEKRFQITGLINAGYILLNKNCLLSKQIEQPFSFETDFLEKELARLRVYGYQTNGYFIDIGVPQDYYRANQDFKSLS